MEKEGENIISGGRGCDFPVILLLLVGFCGVIGLLTTAILRIPLPFTLVFIVLATVGLPFGLSRLRKKERKVKLIVISAVASILLSPAYVPIGIGIGFFTPLVPSYVKDFFTGPNVIQSVTSPDQNFEAYVVERPSIDPPNQSLFIQRSDNIHFVRVAKLAEDIDAIKEIHWSPQSDIVVFHTRCNLIAVRVPGYQTVKIPLGGERIRTKARKRSTFTGAGARVAIADVQFPHAGSFSYRVEGIDAIKTIPMGVF
ncbi:MAG: hypothetical protein ACYS3N_06040 [Planctomycetota bacterium]|jgi:hypothetical protein